MDLRTSALWFFSFSMKWKREDFENGQKLWNESENQYFYLDRLMHKINGQCLKWCQQWCHHFCGSLCWATISTMLKRGQRNCILYMFFAKQHKESSLPMSSELEMVRIVEYRHSWCEHSGPCYSTKEEIPSNRSLLWSVHLFITLEIS